MLEAHFRPAALLEPASCLEAASGTAAALGLSEPRCLSRPGRASVCPDGGSAQWSVFGRAGSPGSQCLASTGEWLRIRARRRAILSTRKYGQVMGGRISPGRLPGRVAVGCLRGRGCGGLSVRHLSTWRLCLARQWSQCRHIFRDLFARNLTQQNPVGSRRVQYWAWNAIHSGLGSCMIRAADCAEAMYSVQLKALALAREETTGVV